MIEVFLESIITVLLIGGSLLLLSWKTVENERNNKLIMRIGACVGLIGVSSFTNVFFNIVGINNLAYSLNKIFELIGLVILMFSLSAFVEGKK